MSDNRPRVLIFSGKVTDELPLEQALSAYCRLDCFADLDQAMHALRTQDYHAIFADVGDFFPLERALVGDKASLVLNTIGEGVCIVNDTNDFVWTNNRMRAFKPEISEHIRRICAQALTIFRSQHGGMADTASHRSKKFTFQVDERYFEMVCSPVMDERKRVFQVVGVVWDATSGRRLQGKIDVIDAAGRELVRLENETVAQLTPSERLKLLQDKIIRFSKDLMHFDHFAIRLLDKRTNKLEVVIAQGLPSEALDIDLYAQPEGNGISGYVASTGRSYICHDTEKDPRYVMGLDHCKSSLTVPLMLFDRIIGVYNIESSKVGAFDEDDRQFAEIFGRYVAMALHILDLLVVERYTTFGQVTDNVVQEVAAPLDEIVTEAQTLMEEYIGEDNMRQRLGRITDHVQAIRDVIKSARGGQRVVGNIAGAQVSADQPLFKGKRILVADDELSIRQTISELLKRYGCEVAACKDGYEACTALEQGRFDLVISDIRMPYRNGYEIFAAAQRTQEQIPVILMTGFGYDPGHSIVRASQQGLSGVLFKPFKVEQLMEEIRKALGVAVTPPTT